MGEIPLRDSWECKCGRPGLSIGSGCLFCSFCRLIWRVR